MKEQYERIELFITAFDQEDVIMTSKYTPEDPIHVDPYVPVIGFGF